MNPSGGLEAKGHPLGATGLGMHFYIASKASSFTSFRSKTDNFLRNEVQLRNRAFLHRSKLHEILTSSSTLGAGKMQAPGLFDIPDRRGKIGMVHNLGLGGACVVSLLRRPEFYREGGIEGKDR